MDLGAGTGVAGITAAHLGSRATLTDLPSALPLLERNVGANNFSSLGSARACALDWHSPQGFLQALPRPVDLVIGADLVYRVEAVAPLISAIESLLAQGSQGCTVLVGHKHRTPAVDAALLEGLQCLGLQCELVGVSATDARCKVYRCRRRQDAGRHGLTLAHPAR